MKQPRRIISGGQTGADRGGLEAGLALGLEIGGYCPKGRRAEDGVIPLRYPLEETESSEYPQRTRQNVEAADATLIFSFGPPDRGTKLTMTLATEARKPHLHVDLAKTPEAAAAAIVKVWIARTKPETLNVAGSRESNAEGLQAATERVLLAALS